MHCKYPIPCTFSNQLRSEQAQFLIPSPATPTPPLRSTFSLSPYSKQWVRMVSLSAPCSSPALRPRCSAVGGPVLGPLPRLVGRWDLQVGGLHVPDVPRVLLDGAVAGEFACSCDVPDDHLGPRFGVLREKGDGGRAVSMGAHLHGPVLFWGPTADPLLSPLALTRYSSLTFSWHLT